MKKCTIKFLSFFLTIISFTLCSQNNEEILVEEEIIIPDNLYPSEDLTIANHSNWTKTHYPKRIAEFKANSLNFNDIVFIGNSITEQGEDWALKVNNPKARNRGIAGDTSDGIIARLNEITFYKPEKVFLLIGAELMAFFDFPAQHWQSIRTSNPIESAFATIRHRTKRSKGCLSRDGMLHMMFKLGQCAEQNWRKLRGFDYLAKVITGIRFKDGIETTNPDQIAA